MFLLSISPFIEYLQGILATLCIACKILFMTYKTNNGLGPPWSFLHLILGLPDYRVLALSVSFNNLQDFDGYTAHLWYALLSYQMGNESTEIFNLI